MPKLQPYKLLTKALHFIDEEKLESYSAKTKKDKIYLQRAACFFIESDYQAADIDANESLKLKLSTKVGIYRKVKFCRQLGCGRSEVGQIVAPLEEVIP